MRYDPRKAFPYPVLRISSSDYQSGSFDIQPDIHRIANSTELRLEVTFVQDCVELDKLLEQNKAKFALVVSSPITFFRTAICDSNREIVQQFESGKLAGRVTLNPYLVATTSIDSFYCDDWHEDYSGMSFNISMGSVLAIGEPHVFHIDIAEESSVASIFRFDEVQTLEKGLWNCRYSADENQVAICLSTDDYRRVLPVRVDASTGDANENLLNGIYFPALVWLLQELDQLTVNGGADEFTECRWYRSLQQKLEDMKCKSFGKGTERLKDAQKIFEMPFGRFSLESDDYH